MNLKMIEKERCCGKCRFYYPEGRECRRYPPQVWSDPQSYTNCTYSCNFPEVTEKTWCGEFQPISFYIKLRIEDSNGHGASYEM